MNLSLLPDDILNKILLKMDNKAILKIINFNDTNINKILFNKITSPPLYFGNYYKIHDVLYITTCPLYKNNNDKKDTDFNCCNCNNKYNTNYFRRRLITRSQYKKCKDRNKFNNETQIINSNTDYNIFNFCGGCGHLFWDDMLFYPAFNYIYYKNKFYLVKKDKERIF